jgi:hypothetical protein
MTVRRSDGYIHVFADRDLSGRAAPVVGEWLGLEEAIERLRATAVVIPGVVSVSWSKGWQQARDQMREKRESEHVKVGVGPRSMTKEELESAVAARCKEEYGIDTSDSFGRPTDVDPSTWLRLCQEEHHRLVNVHRYARDQLLLEDAGEETAVGAPSADANPVPRSTQDVTVAPWGAPPVVTVAPLEQDPWGKRDIGTWGNRDNAGADRSCGDAEVSAELLNEFASRLEEVVDGERPVHDIERAEVDDEGTAKG